MKKRIIRIIIIIVLLVLGTGTLLFLKEFFFSNDAKVIYGTRLKGISKHKISEETKNKVKESIIAEVSDVKIRIAGKIIYIEVKAKENTTLDMAKALGTRAAETFSEDERSYYDIQIMFDSETDNNQFPIIGYKQHSRQNVTWTKDRVS